MISRLHLFILRLLFFLASLRFAQAEDASSPRQTQLLNGSDWQFIGYEDVTKPPDIGTDAFNQALWTNVEVPHNFQTRIAYDTLTKGWYKREVTVNPSAQGKELYLVFEGAATLADVYVNGQHLGQHRGAYTRFVFDATKALHVGTDNQLAVLVNDSPADTKDCLPWSQTGLYKIWGGLYRNVWLVATSPVHIDPKDFAAPGVYLTPRDVSEKSTGLDVRVLLRNTAAIDAQAEVRARILDPEGKEVTTLTAPAPVPASGRSTVELSTIIDRPQLWGALNGHVYHVETSVYLNGKPVDEVTQPTGFRRVEWLTMDGKTGGTVTLNGKRIILYGANLHQEVETKGSAVSPEDLRANFDTIKDLGLNFMRFPHYPHAALEYDLCDQDGILAWAEDGHSNSKDIVSPTAAQIVTEMVKQNYNHPSIVVWSMGNESNPQVADECVPIAKALDPTRPVGVANQKSDLADFHTAHDYFGWYHADMDKFTPKGFISEIGAGGVVTIHCDYDNCDWKVGKYEPEEYQQIVSENNFQRAFHGEFPQTPDAEHAQLGIVISGLTSSNANNPAYYMDMPIHEQWPIYYDLDSNADNSWNRIPPEIENATWIALRRVTVQAGPPTKHDPNPTLDQSTDLSFTATKAEKIYIMATKMDEPPAFATNGPFKEVSPGTTTLWRNNDLLLVPAQLYVHEAAAGEKIRLTLGDRDAVVMIK